MKMLARAAVASALVLCTVPAGADVFISAHATANMSCVAGTCTATGQRAFLNVSDLQTMLASGNVKVRAGNLSPNIFVTKALSWSSASTLTLDSQRSVEIDRPVSVLSNGGLIVDLNDGASSGVFTFGPAGSLHFWSLAGTLTVEDTPYTLVGDLATLASGIAATPNGNFALAASYNAGPDGVYSQSPVMTAFTGRFEGLGNTISNLTIQGPRLHTGLFRLIELGANVNNLRIAAMRVHDTGRGASAGALADTNHGLVRNVHASGKISATADNAVVGGLVAYNTGGITQSSARNFPQDGLETAGGLVGRNDGLISNCFTSGKIVGGLVGGLAGINADTIMRSYSLTDVQSQSASSYPGGLVGDNSGGGNFLNAYAAGPVSGPSNIGGVAGDNISTMGDLYWDTDATGANSSQGCGSGSCSGASPLTHAQLQSALPPHFLSAVWGQDPAINDGLPYLLDNPPQ